MDPITAVLATERVGTALVNIVNRIKESGNSNGDVSVDQAVAMGLAKTQNTIFQLETDFTEKSISFVQDFEKLRYEGLSTQDALNVVQLIYLPKVYLIDNDYFSRELVLALDDEVIDEILNNCLINFLNSNEISPDNLIFEIGGVERAISDFDEFVENEFNSDQKFLSVLSRE